MRTLRTLGTGVLLAGSMWGATVSGQITGQLPTVDNPPTRQGTRGANFLHIPIGARGNAMGTAVGSSVVGPTAWFWNPAGVATTETFSIAAGRQLLYGDLDIAQTYAGLAMPLLGGVVGLSVNTLSSGDLERTTEAAPFGDPQIGRTFSWNSTAAGLGYGRRLTDRLGVGFHIKYVTEGITDASTNWVTFDVGTVFQTGIYGLVVGGALQHIGGASRASGAAINRIFNNAEVNRQTTRTDLFTRDTELPTEFRFSVGEDLYGGPESLLGGGGGPHRLYVEVNANDAVDLATQFGLGVEYGFRNAVFVRAGKRFYNDDREFGASTGAYGLSGGLGARLRVAGRDLRIDYSYTALGELQNTQVFSFELGR